jgi:hypothetical protein
MRKELRAQGRCSGGAALGFAELVPCLSAKGARGLCGLVLGAAFLHGQSSRLRKEERQSGRKCDDRDGGRTDEHVILRLSDFGAPFIRLNLSPSALAQKVSNHAGCEMPITPAVKCRARVGCGLHTLSLPERT